jgi:hypothetical protein
MDFYKYSFDKKPALIATDDLVKFPIFVGGVPKHNGRTGSYVVPYTLGGNFSVQYKLSISYSPNFLYKLDSIEMLELEKSGILELLDNQQNKLNPISQLKLEDLPRIWPSFGYFGGAREVFVKFPKKSSIPLKYQHAFKIPGRRDFYHADDDEQIKLSLISGIVGYIRKKLGTEILRTFFENEGYIFAKVALNEGVAFNITKKIQKQINITSSISYKEITMGSFIKCWLNVWSDDETRGIREFYFVNEAEYIFNRYTLKQLIQIPNFTQSVFEPLFNSLVFLLGKKKVSMTPLFYIHLSG